MEKQESKIRKKFFDKAKELDTSPGVYLMKDDSGQIIYIGKAKNLKNRVSSYFKPSKHDVPRTELMVDKVSEFEVILTKTESEALILESTLIKKHKPRYNVRLKDDKSFPYLKIPSSTPKLPFVRLEYQRKVMNDGARYFGPFPSSGAVRQVVKFFNEYFKLRDCSDMVFKNRARPCILHQMDKCLAPCVKGFAKDKKNIELYQKLLEKIIKILEGVDKNFSSQLRAHMREASENLEFERAAIFRDQIEHLELLTARQGVSDPELKTDMDVIELYKDGELAEAVVLQLRKGKLEAISSRFVQNISREEDKESILSDFIALYYLSEKNPAPEVILVSEKLSEGQLLSETLKAELRVAKSLKEDQFIRVASTNAQYIFKQNKRYAFGHGFMALEETQNKLHLSKLPLRIECFDISNLQGTENVASRVVFVDGAPEKDLYRKYKIKTVTGADDFASMREVLSRRFTSKGDTLPDLVIVDGGRGQLAQALAVVDELDLQGFDVVGLAKAKSFDVTKGKPTQERVFLPNRKNPVFLKPGTDSFRLLTHIRDEAHRFAITYHRKLKENKIKQEKGGAQIV